MPEELKKNYMEEPMTITKAKRKTFKPSAKPKPTERVVCRVEMTSGPALCLADIEHPDLFAFPPDSPQTFHSPVPRPLYIVASVAHRRAGQRWSSLVSARTSRVAKMMQPVLGETHWRAFLAHITQHCKPIRACVQNKNDRGPPASRRGTSSAVQLRLLLQP